MVVVTRNKPEKFRKVKIKAKYYDMGQEKSRTRAIRDPKTGRLLGRYSGVPAYASDTGKYLMMKKDLDIDKDKVPDLYTGQIIARLKKGTRVKPRYIVIKVNENRLKKIKRVKKKKK